MLFTYLLNANTQRWKTLSEIFQSLAKLPILLYNSEVNKNDQPFGSSRTPRICEKPRNSIERSVCIKRNYFFFENHPMDNLHRCLNLLSYHSEGRIRKYGRKSMVICQGQCRKEIPNPQARNAFTSGQVAERKIGSTNQVLTIFLTIFIPFINVLSCCWNGFNGYPIDFGQK